jgi:hypothetical protein
MTPTLWGGPVGSGSGIQVTARNLIHDAIRALGGLRAGQETSSDAYTEYLRWLNQLVDAWNIERLMIPAVARTETTISAGTSELSVGAARVDAAGWISSGSECPLELLSFTQWADSDKSTAGAVTGIYRDGESVFLVQPPAAAGSLALYQWQTLEQFASLDTSYGFRPGYARALTLCLAVEIAPALEIHQKTRATRLPLLMQQAAQAKAAIKVFNLPRTTLKCDPALVGSGGFDILGGEYR